MVLFIEGVPVSERDSMTRNRLQAIQSMRDRLRRLYSRNPREWVYAKKRKRRVYSEFFSSQIDSGRAFAEYPKLIRIPRYWKQRRALNEKFNYLLVYR